MAPVTLEELADTDQRERQDDAVGLGELERALQRGARSPPVAEVVVRRGGEQQRLDR